MRSLLRNGSLRRAQPGPATTIATSTGSSTRGHLRTVAVVAILGAAGTLAVSNGSSSPGTQATQATTVTEASALEAPAVERHLPPYAASRSTERAQLPSVVSVQVDGGTLPVATTAQTLGEALAEAGVVLGAEDEVSHPLGAPVPVGDTVSIARVAYADGLDRTPVPYATTERRDPDLEVGRRVVATAGVPGTQTVAFRARLVDGQEVSREELLRAVVAPVDEVVRVGTKVPPPPPPPAPAAPAPRATSSAAAAPRAATSAPAAGPTATGDPRSIARSMVAARGWGADQFTCLDRLWTKESNWNPRAQNRSSGAYGIPQSLPGSKMATVAADWRTNPATQITWGLNYISGRYGTPCAAWAHSQARNWY